LITEETVKIDHKVLAALSGFGGRDLSIDLFMDLLTGLSSLTLVFCSPN